jgi:hypothetical protein
MPYWRRLSSNQRLLIVCGAAALAIYLGWPSIKSTIGGIGHKLSRGLTDVARMIDPSDAPSCNGYDPGPRRRRQPRGDGDYGEAPGRNPLSRGDGDFVEPPKRRLRFPSEAGNDAGLGRTSNADGFPRNREDRRWRHCLDRPGPTQQCGPWQTGPAPEGV